ncbi:MAG: hypothetical protein LBP32_05760 [Spirochaetaceae bacterium]|jgi:hypothetical protein|nr:hypothetical protein [Spirochaetaceae bacterium]
MRIAPCKYVLILGLVFSVPLAAQDEGRIYHARGERFTLSSRGKPEVYTPETLDPQGLPLTGGDMIQTGRNSFVEIRFEPGGTVIIAAENSSLQFTGAGRPEGTLSIKLFYGRLRLLSGPGGHEISLQAGNAVTVLKEGDIGVDLAFPSGTPMDVPPRPILRVYSFSGAAELIPILEERAAEIPHIGVNNREEVSLRLFSSVSFVERKPLDQNIVNYWHTYQFGTAVPETAAAVPGPEPAVEQGDTQVRYAPPDAAVMARANRGKNAAILTGILFTLAGAAVQGVGLGYFNGGDTGMGKALMGAGFAPIGVGVCTLFIALFQRPSPGP